MEDFIELGIEGVDKVVDKHFHKLPDKALHKDTYHPRNLRKSHRRRGTQDSSPSPERPPYPESPREQDYQRRRSHEDLDPNLAYRDLYTEDETPRYINMQDNEYPPQRGYSPPRGYSPQVGYQDRMYSHEPPHLRPQYVPAGPPPPGIGQQREYPAPPNTYYPPRANRGRNGYDFDDGYHSDVQQPPRRPKMDRRRSSSYHGPRDGQLALAGKRNGNGNGMVEQARDKAHRYGLKDEFDVFTKSKAGLTGGAVGAVVGGWAAHKAQVAKKGKQDTNDLLTLLGAAVGGLAVNAVVDRWEGSRRDTEEKQERWDEKWDRNGSRSRSGSESPPRRRRERRNSYDEGR